MLQLVNSSLYHMTLFEQSMEQEEAEAAEAAAAAAAEEAARKAAPAADGATTATTVSTKKKRVVPDPDDVAELVDSYGFEGFVICFCCFVLLCFQFGLHLLIAPRTLGEKGPAQIPQHWPT
jgi:hypothetical protein